MPEPETDQSDVRMRIAHPHTALAEDTFKRLAIRQMDYHTVLSVRLDHLWGRHQPNIDARHENALVDAVSATELFTSQLLRDIHPTLTDNDIFSWKKREMSWAKHASVALSDAGDGDIWPELRGYIEIRNAIQHGLGRLTDLQLLPDRRVENLTFIRATGCQLLGDVVRVTSVDVDRCFGVCATFISWLDATVV